MAKFGRNFKGNFEDTRSFLNDLVLNTYSTSSKEEEIIKEFNQVKHWFSVYEIYSIIGSNRLSISISLFEYKGEISLDIVGSGGSQAMFFKINTWGEENAVGNLIYYIDNYIEALGSDKSLE